MLIHKRLGLVVYEVPGGAPGGAPPTPSVPQPGAPGQGPAGQGAPDFRQQNFPNVPDDAWTHVEPHAQRIQGYVTQLEQRYAPLKDYSPEGIQGLAQFAQQFESDPVGMWMRTARMLAERGVPGLSDLDLDHLEAMLNGQEPPDEGDPSGGAPQLPGMQAGLPPEAQQLIQSLQAEVAELKEGFTTNQQKQRETVENAALQRQLGWMKEQLKSAGIDESLLTPERLLSNFIAHRGNVQAAVKDAQEYRTAILQGLVPDPNNPGPGTKQPLKPANGGPPAPTKRPGSPRRGMFRDVTASAEQAVARMNQEG